jgi:cold shock protein
MTHQQGTVKFFNHERGFGFIKPDNGSDDVFVHITSLADRSVVITEGDKVSFEYLYICSVPRHRRGEAQQMVPSLDVAARLHQAIVLR